jgi:membrane protease YdiL (CAAX protease family)
VNWRSVPSWLDLGDALAVWLPFELGILNAYAEPFAVLFVAVYFCGVRGLTGVGLRLSFNRSDIVRALWSFLAFSLVAIPFGLATGFMVWNPQVTPLKFLAGPFAVFLCIGIPEELLFRGLMQNIVAQMLGRPVVALLLVSVFFGATHLNNTPTPDWRFFTLATLAGLFYGYNYMKARSLVGPALVHTLVDAVWFLFLMKDKHAF